VHDVGIKARVVRSVVKGFLVFSSLYWGRMACPMGEDAEGGERLASLLRQT